MNRLFAFAFSVVGVVALAACSSGGVGGSFDEDESPASNAPNSDESETASCTEKPESQPWVGFGKTDLTADRVNEGTRSNRYRVKPFGVLGSEYKRVLGTVPVSLQNAASTFPEETPRYSEEKRSGALQLNALYDSGFQGCLEFVKSPAEYGAAPDEATAKKNCPLMMRKFWSKDAAPAELDACVKHATTSFQEEPDARRRWAYVCASLLTSSQFLTY